MSITLLACQMSPVVISRLLVKPLASKIWIGLIQSVEKEDFKKKLIVSRGKGQPPDCNTETLFSSCTFPTDFTLDIPCNYMDNSLKSQSLSPSLPVCVYIPLNFDTQYRHHLFKCRLCARNHNKLFTYFFLI